MALYREAEALSVTYAYSHYNFLHCPPDKKNPNAGHVGHKATEPVLPFNLLFAFS